MIDSIIDGLLGLLIVYIGISIKKRDKKINIRANLYRKEKRASNKQQRYLAEGFILQCKIVRGEKTNGDLNDLIKKVDETNCELEIINNDMLDEYIKNGN